MNGERDRAGRAPRSAPRGLRLHLLLYAGINGILFAIDVLTAGPWWFYWPALGWGAGLALHVLYIKVVGIDDAWAERKAMDLRERAYDVGHIVDIEERRKEVRSPDSQAMAPVDPPAGRE